MPTVFSHAAVPLAMALGAGTVAIPPRLLLAGIAASVIPDLDVVSVWAGVPYGHDLAHRGVTHSLCFALALGALAMALAPLLSAARGTALLFVSLACASHGLLDMLTNGGSGIALLWPFTSERFFWPRQVIEVSPLGLGRLMSRRGAAVLASELLWLWLPAAGLALAWRSTRLLRARGDRASP